MERELARRTIASLCDLMEAIHRPLNQGVPELSAYETLVLKTGVGGVIGCSYTNLMFRILHNHPDLDPDPPGDEEKGSGHWPLAEGLARSEFGRQLASAADDAEMRLRAILDDLEKNCDASEPNGYRDGAHDVLQHIRSVRSLGQSL